MRGYFVFLESEAPLVIDPHSIFISHKNGDGPLAHIRAALFEKLRDYDRAGTFLVYADDFARPGRLFWSKEKDECLAACSCAVVLLDEAAARSAPVQNEITILCYRRSISPGFR